jgi:serine/threonine protein phosphatase 1
MENEKIFVVGDIHGCLDLLNRLMDKINWEPARDRLIFIGDYIDRGKDPKGVVDYILALAKCSNRIQCLIGNHESIFLDYLAGKDRGLFLFNGGWSTLESYQGSKLKGPDSLLPKDHLTFYKSLETTVELEDFYIVHAGFKPGVAVENQSLEDMLWIRERFIYSDYDFGKKVIFGHTPFVEPLVAKNKIGLDTGAVYGNKLTCLELPEMRFHSVGRES